MATLTVQDPVKAEIAWLLRRLLAREEEEVVVVLMLMAMAA